MPRARVASIDRSRAWACGERRKAAWSRPGRVTSSTKRPSPRRKRGSSRRRTAAPKYFAPISRTGSALRASGPDPVEPRRERGDEEPGQGDAADDAEDAEERDRDGGDG